MGFYLQPNAKQKYVCVVFVCAAGKRKQRVLKWYLSCLAIKLLHLIGTNLPWSLWNTPGIFCFFLAYDLLKGLPAVCWVMLWFRNRDTVHSTGPFILLPWTWGGQRTPTRREKMLQTGRWCFLEEWNYTKRKKRAALPWRRGNFKVLRVDLGVWK